MLVKEAKWLGRRLAELPDRALFPLLNLGSGTGHFRASVQPWIDQHVFAPLRRRSQQIWHSDVQKDEGVDLAGDLTDPSFQEKLTEAGFRAVLCSNLLEHLANREEVARLVARLVPVGGYVLVSCPYRFPYHPDPIDTMFRPTALELAALFPGMSVQQQDVVACGTLFGLLFSQTLRRPLGMLRAVLRRASGNSTSSNSSRGEPLMPWFFKRFLVTCLVLRKVEATDANAPHVRPNPPGGRG